MSAIPYAPIADDAPGGVMYAPAAGDPAEGVMYAQAEGEVVDLTAAAVVLLAVMADAALADIPALQAGPIAVTAALPGAAVVAEGGGGGATPPAVIWPTVRLTSLHSLVVPAAPIRPEMVAVVHKQPAEADFYEIDFDRQYLHQMQDAAAQLLAVVCESGAVMASMPAAGASMSTGVVLLYVDSLATDKVTLRIRTASGREKEFDVLVKVKDV